MLRVRVTRLGGLDYTQRRDEAMTCCVVGFSGLGDSSATVHEGHNYLHFNGFLAGSRVRC